MRIKRAVKCAAKKEELKEALEVAEKAHIRGLEVQEIFPLMEKLSFRERGKIIIDSLRNYSLTSLAFHFPIKPSFDDIKEAKKFDFGSEEGSYVFRFTEETIKEAALVGKALKIKTEIPIVVHLFGFALPEKITLEERDKKLNLGEKRLLQLKEIANFYSEREGLKLRIARENHSPSHGKVLGLLDFHPQDTIRTSNLGIGTTLDFSHLWLTVLYYKNGKGEFPGVDLSKKIYPEIKLGEVIDFLKSSLRIIHLNGGGPGYQGEFEGLEIGKGNLPHSEIVPLICNNLKENIIGTYEIKYGHIHPEKMLRSDQFYRKIFKEKFREYFE